MYNTKIVRDRKVGSSYEKVVHVSKNNGYLNTDDIVGIYRSALNQYDKAGNKNAKFLIRAMNNKQIWIFKGYNDDDINIQSAEDYYEGKVVDPKVADKFISAEIQVLYDK